MENPPPLRSRQKKMNCFFNAALQKIFDHDKVLIKLLFVKFVKYFANPLKGGRDAKKHFLPEWFFHRSFLLSIFYYQQLYFAERRSR